MRIKWSNYNDYLNSPEWEAIKEEVYKSRDGHCMACCDFSNLELHHVTYPKDWNKDKAENVIILYKKCHQEFHDSDNVYELIQKIVKFERDVAELIGGIRVWNELTEYKKDIKEV